MYILEKCITKTFKLKTFLRSYFEGKYKKEQQEMRKSERRHFSFINSQKINVVVNFTCSKRLVFLVGEEK